MNIRARKETKVGFLNLRAWLLIRKGLDLDILHNHDGTFNRPEGVNSADRSIRIESER